MGRSMSLRCLVSISTLLLFFASSSLGQQAELSPEAPEDKPVSVEKEQEAQFLAAMEPYVKQAKDTYLGAKRRYLKGLPVGEMFFVTTRLVDYQDLWEQVFIRVEGIRGEIITGTIASDIRTVSGFKSGDSYRFPESELVDWLIANPDGSEEGNFVGKFLDELSLPFNPSGVLEADRQADPVVR